MPEVMTEMDQLKAELEDARHARDYWRGQTEDAELALRKIQDQLNEWDR